MSLVVQDDTGEVVGANGYISVAYLLAYHLDRANTVPGDSTAREAAIVKATDYMDKRFRFVGSRLTDEQETEWPREWVYSSRGTLLTVIPEAVKRACAEYALRAISDDLLPDPEVAAGGAVTQETKKIGPIETTFRYSEGSQPTLIQPYPAADRLLRDFTQASGGRVER